MIDSAATPAHPGVTRPSGLAWLKRLVQPSPSPLNLALQGGGAHGAFTWGVLDALLEDPRIEFEGLSGSSAGAMNAVVFADGWMKGGRDGARQGLSDFWTEVGKQMPWGLMTQGEGEAINLSPASKLLVNWAGYFSPAQLNPLDLNPLRDLLNRLVDFEQLRARSPFKLFVGTTQANTGKLRVFRERELSVDVMLASACLPKIHHSVEIDGEPYWDGGYAANPAVFPLFYDCDSRDVLLVLLSPLKREGTPNTVDEIESRIAELAFSANFMREMRMFVHAAEFSSPTFMTWGRLERRLQKMRFHMIDASELVSLQRTETKLLVHAPFLELLCGQGRERATAWLSESADGIGRRSTVDMKKWFF
ncbi:patatin-like phospholipase family protein [Rhodoferax ferrireducens]|uniref:patatin-like phospholipase family protein n=1 Tax=Rhodoferax ferrireducens TaxID=192843 RepID=UPI00298E5B6A|nr:patatin-like phospholipase family protein [Rhodoferax ferrireducens]WPC68874.1 patatin-like phospholipase family protein [Rhodoferax ferrireducens]